jgi:chemotaxis protein methyltransferase CheR
MPPDERPPRRAGDPATVRPPIGRESPPQNGPPPLPLAHGDLTEAEAADLLVLKQQIQATVGFYCQGYKEKCLRRRIAVRMRARGVHAYADYAALLRHDPAEYDKLVDALTINVSKFYRNPEVWSLLSERVLPELLALPDDEIRIWSAGAASGEEPYSASIMVREHVRAHGGDAARCSILGTDIDRDSLRFAERAEYSDFAMTDIPPELLERWFEHDGVFRLRPEVRDNVRFEVLDLIRDPFPERQHLIFCRNVIIYFERSIQEQLFARFHDALVPGGYLVLGKVEALFGTAGSLFQTVANRQRVFRRT